MTRKKDKAKELQKAVRESTDFARRHIDKELQKKRESLEADLLELIWIGDEEAFKEGLRALGISDGTPHFLGALSAWREKHGRPS